MHRATEARSCNLRIAIDRRGCPEDPAEQILKYRGKAFRDYLNEAELADGN